MLLARLPLACIALAEADALSQKLPPTGEVGEIRSQLRSLTATLASLRRHGTPVAYDQAERLADTIMGIARKVLALHAQTCERQVRAAG